MMNTKKAFMAALAVAGSALAASSADATLYLNIYFDGAATPSVSLTDAATPGQITYAGTATAARPYATDVQWDSGVPNLLDPDFTAMANIVTSRTFTGTHTIKVLYSQTNLTNAYALDSSVGFNKSAGTSTITSRGYISTSNAAFAETTPLSALLTAASSNTQLTASSFNFTSAAATHSPFSETIETNFKFTAASQTSQANYQLSGEVPAPVPEPASWALMLVGFGGMGAVLRSNRRGKAAFNA